MDENARSSRFLLRQSRRGRLVRGAFFEAGSPKQPLTLPGTGIRHLRSSTAICDDRPHAAGARTNALTSPVQVACCNLMVTEPTARKPGNLLSAPSAGN